MKKLIAIFSFVFVGVLITNAQNTLKFRDISVNWYCTPNLSQEVGDTVYYTCNYQNSNGIFIFSISIKDLKADLEKFDIVRSDYVSSFLSKIEENTLLNKGLNKGKILGKTKVASQNSIQYSDVTKIDSEITLKSMTATFIYKNNAYMVNLISNLENSKLKEEFDSLLKKINV